MSALKHGQSVLKARVSPLPPVGFAAIHPATTVEEALNSASALSASLSEILESLVEPVNLYALEVSARLAGELVDAALDALRKEGQQ
ncbi:TPA: hypothetical protein RG893_001961 [Pseudomonas aeruginosa]